MDCYLIHLFYLIYTRAGLLTHALESGRTDVAYLYDSVGRLMTRRDNYGTTLQLVYANAMNPSQISHVYNFTSRTLYGLLYDDRGHLLAVDNGRCMNACIE